jgi:hypothetical protein
MDKTQVLASVRRMLMHDATLKAPFPVKS